jgi:prevent-host-death family protein
MAKELPARPTEVGVKELRADLSAWLRRVRDGASIVVTDRGAPIARLTPVGSPTGLDRLVAEGRVRLPLDPKLPADAKGIPVRGSVTELVTRHRR